MRDFSTNFPTISFENWLQKTEKDLKGKSIDDICWSWGENGSHLPIQFTSPEDGFSVPLASSSWAIAESFTVESPAQSNHDILQALNMGLECVHLELSKPLSKNDWEALLDKVILTYIQLHIIAKNDQSSLLTLNEVLKDKDWSPEQISIITSSDIEFPADLQTCKKTAVPIDINLESTATQLAKSLRLAEQQLLEGNLAEHLVFNIQLSKSFYHNIACIQAVKIVWQNILDTYQIDPYTLPVIKAHIAAHDGLDENTQKINATIQAVSAVVCGIDLLVIHPITTAQDEDFERRINRNIQHLLKLESDMHQTMNPTTGSYYFDHLTQSLAEDTWQAFKVLD